MDIIYLIGACFSFFFAILLFNKKGKTLADKILFLWFMVMAVHLLSHYWTFIELHKTYPHILGLTDGFPFLYGPFLYFYTDTIISKKSRLKKSYALHLIPFALWNLTYLPFFFADGTQKIQYFLQKEEIVNPVLLTVGIVLKLLSGPVYIGWVWFKLKGHKKNIQEYFSNTEEIDLQWLKNLTKGLATFWMVVLLALLLESVFDVPIPSFSNEVIFAALSVCVIALGYFGLKQKAVFTDIHLSESPLSEQEQNRVDKSPNEDLGKYQRSGLKEEEAQMYVNYLLAHMQKQKPYLRSNLSIEDLSAELDIARHNLSQVINQELNKNFYQFVNEFRVEEAKLRILDPANQHLTLLAIGYDSGFNSKASFNTVFKQYTDMTPSQFRKSSKSLSY